MLDDTGDQVATVHGRWGNTVFADLLRPLLDWYRPLICGEQQVGLPVLRQLYRWGYWMYYDRDEKKKSRPMMDKLGHFKTHAHLPIMLLRQALFPFRPDGSRRVPDITIRDAEVLAEVSAFQFLPPAGADLQDVHDTSLTMGAPAGTHDDLVNAAGYSWMALRDMPHFPPPEPKFAPNSIAVQLGMVDDLMGRVGQEPGGVAWRPPTR